MSQLLLSLELSCPLMAQKCVLRLTGHLWAGCQALLRGLGQSEQSPPRQVLPHLSASSYEASVMLLVRANTTARSPETLWLNEQVHWRTGGERRRREWRRAAATPASEADALAEARVLICQQQQLQGERAAAGNAVPVYDLQYTQASFLFRPPPPCLSGNGLHAAYA